MSLNLVIICVVLMDAFVCGVAVTIKIGAIFDTPGPHKQRALDLAVERLNAKYAHGTYSIQPLVEHLNGEDPLEATSATCSLMKQGVAGILGPSLEHNLRTVQSICDDKDVPYLDVRWADLPGTPTINFYPSQSLLTRLYVDVIAEWRYGDFVVLYDNADSLRRIMHFVELYDEKEHKHKILLRQLDRHGSGDYRPMLKEVKKSGVMQLMLDCSVGVLREVLIQAQQVGLMSDRHTFFITNLDLHTLDLVPFQYGDTNITGIRLFDPQSQPIQELAQYVFAEEIKEDPVFVLLAPYRLQLDAVLLVDAVTIFAETLKEVPDIPEPLDCMANKRWLSGLTITNLIKSKEFSGLSGKISFGSTGYRNKFPIDIFELKEGGITKIGNWTDDRPQKLTMTNRSQKLRITRPLQPPDEEDSRKSLKDSSFRVRISLIEPFARYKTSSSASRSEDELYEGYAIELIHELSLLEGFNYTFHNQPDKKNGEYNSVTEKWEGMIGALIANEADLAIADLTITASRQKAVDFTTPFMNLGISILYQKPRKVPPSFFSFADPFALEVWVLVALSYLTVSLVLFVLGRICASEWTNPYPCIEEPEFLVNQLSLRNCFWFVSGSIMQQGTEIGPLALSTRLVAGIWWFFALIMVSSYTANLAVFLTRETPIPHFNDVFELVKNAEDRNIKWGAKKSGSTVDFFNENRKRYEEYGKIYDYMTDKKNDVLVQDPTEGVARAERENYAFFMEITSIEYEIQRRCNLTGVGKLLDEKSYGIAMRKNSTYRNALSRAILQLQHSGKLNELQRKWWEEKRGGGFCESQDNQLEATALNLKSVGGVFWVTIAGVFLAVLLVVAELILHVVKASIQTKAPFKHSLLEEFRFYVKFGKKVKPVARISSNLETTSRISSRRDAE